MAQEQNISTQLNDLLVTHNFPPETLRDRLGNESSPEEAKTFTFDYVSGSGKNYGTMVIVLDSDNDMKVFYGDNLGRTMEGNDKDEFFDFQQQLSKFANARRWTYTGSDLSRLKRTMQGLAAIQEGLFEGYYGTKKVSYAGEPTQARLMIKHNRTLGEADARFRYVESLFIETADYQRFKLGFKNLAGGRAMLEHVRQGGNPYDVRGVHIAEMVMEIATLGRFNRASANRMLEGVTKELVTEAHTYYKSLRENMKRLASPRGYTAYFETWHPATIDEQQELVEDIKTLFIEQTLDTRIEAALPLLARIQQQGNTMKEAEIFENWANNLVEGTWTVPETPEQEEKLRELLSSEFIVGPDAVNATEQLYDLIGDDNLFDQLGEIAAQDPDADVRDVVIDRLKELGYDLGIEVADSSADANSEMPAEEPEQGVAEGSEHQQQDLDDVADWMNTTPDKVSVEVRQEPIEKFIKQIREMYGTYDEFPKDEQRTNRILKLLKRGAQPLPVYVEANDPDLFVMEGRHRMVAFWLVGMKSIPVAYVSIKGQQGVAEGSDLDVMRKAAGLPVLEGRMLDESGETLSHIMDRFKHEVDQFEKGGDLDNDLYYALFDYYSDHGEIPYGIAKGRDGDPFEWITDRLDQELGTGNHAPRDLPEADPISTFEVMSGFAAPVAEGACNMTAEGEYCPDHGLMECGTMMEMGTVAGGMAPVMDEQGVAEGQPDPLARLKSLALRK